MRKARVGWAHMAQFGNFVHAYARMHAHVGGRVRGTRSGVQSHGLEDRSGGRATAMLSTFPANSPITNFSRRPLEGGQGGAQAEEL